MVIKGNIKQTCQHSKIIKLYAITFLKETTEADSSVSLLDPSSNLTPMVNFLPDFIRKEGTLISKPLPRMKFIFQEAYATLELAFYVQTFYNVTVF